MNPFKYGIVVSGEDFCSRDKLLLQIQEHVESSQNLVVVGDRRMGKTSLVYEAVRKKKGLKILYVDFMGIKSVDMLCQRILRAVLYFEKSEQYLGWVFRKLSHLKPLISADPITGIPTASFNSSLEIKAESVVEVLDMIKSIHKKVNIVVVFDEFQDILKIDDSENALALLRSSIQFQVDVPYIFAGSSRHKIDYIFSDPSSAFFKSAIPITVGPIPKDEFSFYISKKLESGRRKITESGIDSIFKVTNQITGDIQQLCSALWEVTDSEVLISKDHIAEAVKLIFSREQKSYELFLNQITNLQYKCLKVLAVKGGKKISSSEFVNAVGGGSNASSIRKSILRLVEINLLFETENQYKFTNPFFRAWILYRG